MKKESLGIATGGERRLREAIEVQVRRELEQETSATTEHWQKVALEDKIKREVKKRMRQVASPQSVWSSL